jgi:serine/arginine repetitive matrix protein 2
MSYNNIGLPTPRGTGTSGYVTRNLSSIQSKTNHQTVKKPKVERPPPDPQILLHQRKRQLEAAVLQYKEDLEIDGKTAEEIKELAKAFRQNLIDDGFLERIDETASGGSHQLSFEKQRELSKLKSALGIAESHVTGEAFDFESQEVKREQRMAEKYENLKKQVAAGADVETLMKPPARYLDRVSDRKPTRRSDDGDRSRNRSRRDRSSERYSRHRDRSRSRDSYDSNDDRRSSRRRRDRD